MDFNSLNEYLQKFWTEKKLGKHNTDIANQHGMILLKNLKTEPVELFNVLDKNKFNFQEFDVIPWSDFLRRSHLSDFLKPEYVDDALQVTTTRPAIGKGEFLLVSCFANIGFAKSTGDIVDLQGNKKIEVKGLRATISGDGKNYKLMNNSLITSLFSIYDSSDTVKYFNRDCAERLEELVKNSSNDNKLIEVFKRLQNVNASQESESVAKKFVQIYKTTGTKLFNVIGAMQLYMYLNGIDYLVMVNQLGFKCFALDREPMTYLNMILKNKIKLSSWETGTRGMEISI